MRPVAFRAGHRLRHPRRFPARAGRSATGRHRRPGRSASPQREPGLRVVGGFHAVTSLCRAPARAGQARGAGVPVAGSGRGAPASAPRSGSASSPISPRSPYGITGKGMSWAARASRYSSRGRPSVWHLPPLDQPLAGRLVQAPSHRGGGDVAVQHPGADLVAGRPLRAPARAGAGRSSRRAAGQRAAAAARPGTPNTTSADRAQYDRTASAASTCSAADLRGPVREGVRGGEADHLRIRRGSAAPDIPRPAPAAGTSPASPSRPPPRRRRAARRAAGCPARASAGAG